jgi:hypothetical protein
MPHKDPITRKAYKHAYYLLHKEKYVIANQKIKLARQAARLLKKELEAQNPKPPKQIFCTGCGVSVEVTPHKKQRYSCLSCTKRYMQAYRAKKAERIAILKKEWVSKNKEHKAAQDRQYALQNPEARKTAREKWAKNNHAKNNALKAANKISRKFRVPKWLTKDDLWMIEQAYEIATLRTKMFGFAWHVDHILPLHGKTVTGLHVPTNLQVIPWIDNVRKKNKVLDHGRS